MSKRRDVDWLQDIIEAITRIRHYTAEMTFTAFLEDLKTQDAVIRNLEIIGEATKQLSPNLRAQHDHIPWRNMAGMRDKLIHDYFGVNFDVVWEVISEDLPRLAFQLPTILNSIPPAE